MSVLIKNGKIYGDHSVTLTQAQYDALSTTEKNNGTVYYITDGTASYPTAATTRYDHTDSGLTANSVQDAIDELSENLNGSFQTVSSNDIPTANGTFTTINTLTIGPGLWLVIGNIMWAMNSNGIRICLLSAEETTYNNVTNSTLGTGRSDLQKIRLIETSTTSTIYLRAYQTSGESLNANGCLQVIRLK